MSRSRTSNKAGSGNTVVIELHAAAPTKPEYGKQCNGCGACCAAEPCPVSRLWLGHRQGSCPALTWSEPDGRYYCGMVSAPDAYVAWLPPVLRTKMAKACRRWISAGSGCDFDAQIL